MSKVRSAIITAIVVAVIVAGAFFAVVSFPYNSKTNRWNSLLELIPMGSEFTGDVETVVYPEGVVSAAEYMLYSQDPDPDEYDDEDDYSEALDAVNEYRDRYVLSDNGKVYLDTEMYTFDEEDRDTKLEYVEDLKDDVRADAGIMRDRFSKMGYSSYSVSVVDDYGIKVTVASGYTYADFIKEDYLNDEYSSSSKISYLSTAVSSLTMGGELQLYTTLAGVTNSYDDDIGGYALIGRTHNASEYFKSVSTYSYGGTYAIKFKLTSDGKDFMNDITTKIMDAGAEASEDSDDVDATILFYVGDQQLMSLSLSSVINTTFYVSVTSEVYASTYASVLNSIIKGDTVSSEYTSENSDSVTLYYATSVNGRAAAMSVAIFCLIVLVALCAVSVFRYRKLGWVNVMMLLLYALIMIYAAFLLSIELSIATILCALLGMGLLTAVNFIVFENVRECVKQGHVMRNAIAEGYRKHRTAILDAHIVLLIVAFTIYLIGNAAVAACGLALTIAVLASYALYWFTRLMWYVCSSPVPKKSQFAFCGFERVEVEDDDD